MSSVMRAMASNVPNMGIAKGMKNMGHRAAEGARSMGRRVGSMTAGKRKRKGRKTKKARKSKKARKGGFSGAIEQAVVPFGLLAVQKRMQKRSRKSGRKSRKSRRR